MVKFTDYITFCIVCVFYLFKMLLFFPQIFSFSTNENNRPLLLQIDTYKMLHYIQNYTQVIHDIPILVDSRHLLKYRAKRLGRKCKLAFLFIICRRIASSFRLSTPWTPSPLYFFFRYNSIGASLFYFSHFIVRVELSFSKTIIFAYLSFCSLPAFSLFVFFRKPPLKPICK